MNIPRSPPNDSSFNEAEVLQAQALNDVLAKNLIFKLFVRAPLISQSSFAIRLVPCKLSTLDSTLGILTVKS